MCVRVSKMCEWMKCVHVYACVCYWRASQHPEHEYFIRNCREDRQIHDNVRIRCNPWEVGRSICYKAMWSWTFILTHQVFYCTGTPNWSYTINLALTKPWSFSVSVFRTLGRALSEEAITGLKGSSGITLQQDIRKDCSQSGLRAWLENGSQCRDEIITAAIGWTQSSHSSRDSRAAEPYRDERSKYKQHTKLPQSSCVHLFKWLAGQCMICHSWVTGRNEE